LKDIDDYASTSDEYELCEVNAALNKLEKKQIHTGQFDYEQDLITYNKLVERKRKIE